MEVIKVKCYAETPNDLQLIYWVHDGKLGWSICQAWYAQHEINYLESAGYTIVDINTLVY